MARKPKKRSSVAPILLVLLLAVAAIAFIVMREPVEDEITDYLYPQRFVAEIERSCEEFGLPIELVLAVIHTESGFEPFAVSRAGAKGLMQITDDTNDWIAMLLREKSQPERIYEPEFNIRRGCCLLSYLIEEFGETEVALAAYNAGIGRVRGWLADKQYSSDGHTLDTIPISETREYVRRIAEATEIYAAQLYGKKDSSEL